MVSVRPGERVPVDGGSPLHRAVPDLRPLWSQRGDHERRSGLGGT
ncbi:hypothetical protein [Phenylobacterium sp. CCH12-B4]